MFGGITADDTLLKDHVQLLEMQSWVGHHCWYMCSMCSCMIHVCIYMYVLRMCHTVVITLSCVQYVLHIEAMSR